MVKGFDGHPISNSGLVTPGFGKVCPSLRINLEARPRNAGGVAMSAEAKFREDKRWHVVCNRDGWEQQVAR